MRAQPSVRQDLAWDQDELETRLYDRQSAAEQKGRPTRVLPTTPALPLHASVRSFTVEGNFTIPPLAMKATVPPTPVPTGSASKTVTVRRVPPTVFRIGFAAVCVLIGVTVGSVIELGNRGSAVKASAAAPIAVAQAAPAVSAAVPSAPAVAPIAPAVAVAPVAAPIQPAPPMPAAAAPTVSPVPAPSPPAAVPQIAVVAPAPAAVVAPAVAVVAPPVPVAPPATPVAPARVTIHIDTAPAGAAATLVDAGQSVPVGNTPLTIDLDPSHPYDVVLALDGHQTRIEHFDPKATTRLAVTLGSLDGAPVPAAAPARAAVASAPPPRAARKISRPATAPSRPVTRKVVATRDDSDDGDDGAASKDGVLQVSAKPVCAILIDGKATGLSTPQRSLPLKLGKHTVTLVNAEQGIHLTAAVVIGADHPTKLIQDFTK